MTLKELTLKRIKRCQDEARILAKKRQGKCLKLPKRLHDYGRWRCCETAHSAWDATLAQIRGTKKKKGSWCPSCAHTSKIGTKTQRIWAKRFQGSLVQVAQRTTFKAKWRCKYHGEFFRAFNSMKNSGTFCPACSASLGERKCKAALEQLFGKKFDKKRFKDLRGIGGNPLEIDLYNEDLRLGVEHHGAQHYVHKKFFGLNRFQKQQVHDRRRRDYCKANGITLIEIRQVGEITPDNNLKEIIYKACLNGGIPLPLDFHQKVVNLDPASLPNKDLEMWERLLHAANERRWKIISKKYLGVLTPHEFLCDNGHHFLKKPMGIFAGEGCRICNRLQPVALEDGRLFESVASAAKQLKTTSSHISFALRHNGRTQGLRVAGISHAQFSLFKRNPAIINKFWGNLPKSRLVGAKGKSVILSDGRKFDSIASAARALGFKEEKIFAVYNALKRGASVAGVRIGKVS
jgi:hypothetical protein